MNSKRKGTLGKGAGSPRAGTNVVDLMTALQQSLKGGTNAPVAKAKKPKAATGQREMLLPISGKVAKKVAESKPAAKQPAKSRKAS